jgi:hypothetical protein
MKKWLIIFVLPATAFAVYSMVWLDGNNWLCPFYNDARWALDITVGTGEAGGSWPSPLLNKYMFGAGTWIGCVAGTDTLVSMGYNPNSGRTEMFPTLVRYWREGSADSADRVYKYPGDWPPPAGRFPMAPQDPVGDMTLWSCCCDSDPSSHIAPGRPLGLDLCLTVFLYEAARAQDFFFLEYELTNSSGSRHDSLIFGILCDHDVGAHADDMVGLILDDSFHVGGREIRVTNTGFGYDYDNIEVRNSRNQWERGTPGAVAVRLLDGPNGLGLTAFKKFTIGINPTTDPDQYLTLAGYDYRTGVYAPFDSIDAAPDDKRFLLASGPFPLEPDSTARFVSAVIGSPFGRDRTKER